jgi:hypothetical protein
MAERRAMQMSGVQSEMENLLKVIGADDIRDESEDAVNQEDFSDVRMSGESTVGRGFLDEESKGNATAGHELSIFGHEGQLLYQDIVDGDLTEHDEVLTSVFMQAKSSARLHLIRIKQRLISEKDAALQTIDRQHQIQLQKKQEEVEYAIKQQEAAEAIKDHMIRRYEILSEKVVVHTERSRLIYGSEFSMMRIFGAWKTFTIESRKNEQLNNLAAAMRRRSVLARTFTRMNRENQVRRLERERQENLRRVDQVTKEVSTTY